MTSCACGRPAGSFTLCRVCARDLANLLAAVPALVIDLDVTLTRQDRVNEPQGRSGRTEQPLPFNISASDVGDLLRLTLTAWAGVLGLSTNSTVNAAQYLAHEIEEIRGRPDALELLDEVDHAVERARETVDRHTPLLWFGVCGNLTMSGPCPGDLHGPPDDFLVFCPRCRASHDAQARRNEVLAVAVDRSFPAADLVRLSRSYGLPTTKHVVAGLVRRGRLEPSGEHADGRPVFRVGDLLDLLAGRQKPA